MPFTAAHPAIILPFARHRWFSATALVMGSMAPDFEYFFRLRTDSEISHTLPGLLLFNLPTAVFLSIIFHTLVRDLAIKYLPLYFKRRALAAAYPTDWLQYLGKNWLIISSSALVGAFSHLFWDSFTHDEGFFVELIPALLTPVQLPIINLNMELCRVIQHLGTVVGFVLILWFVHLLPAVPEQRVTKQPWFGFWTGIFIAGFLFLLLNVLMRQHLSKALGDLIATLISGWVLTLVLLGIIVKLRQKTKKGSYR